MRLIEVVILAGSHCVSPLQGGDGVTEVVKVPCAVMVRHDAATDAVEIVPSAAATDPQVIAILVKPDGSTAVAMAEASDEVSAKGDRAVSEDEGDGGDVIPIATPRVKPVRSEATEQAKEKTQSRVKRTAQARKKPATRKLADRCGSYRAVWYTAKDGHKRYRCVKTG
jgi:hypothetical protein